MKYTNTYCQLHRLAVAAGLLFGAIAAPAQAAHPGDPDPSFGQLGYLTNDFFGSDEQIHAVLPLRDGRFFAAGVVTASNRAGPGSSQNVALARYLPNGQLDDTFSSGGLFHLDIDGGTDSASAVKLSSDGGLLVGATLTTSAHADFGVVKLLPDGRLDTRFGEPDAGTARKGYVRLDIGGANIHDEVAALATQSDGRIVVAGITRVLHANGFLYSQVALARFDVNGELDTRFGAGAGFVVLPPFLGDDGDILTGIALDEAGNLGSDDRIVLVGYTFARNNAFIARLNADGSPDDGFGSHGRVTIQAGSSGGQPSGVSILSAARIARDGSLVVLGEGGDRGLTLMRFGANGAPDATFGNGGRVTVKYSLSSDYDEPAALALQGNGKIVAAGYATNRATGAARKDFYVVRLLANGAIDNGFGDGQGRVVAQVSSEDDEAFAAAVEPSGNLLVGGYQQRLNVNGRDFALLRLIGDPDRIFMDGFDGPGFD
ncbi:MAG TPA: hypothetical protein VGC55_17630 [Dokdonella sp.]